MQSSAPWHCKGLSFLGLNSTNQKNLFEIARTTEVSEQCDINGVELAGDTWWVLLLHFSRFVCKIGTLSQV